MNARHDILQHVLIVDDSEVDRSLVRSCLIKGAPRRRYKFYEAKNGQEAMQICQDPDVIINCIILDIHMPRHDGLSFMKNLVDSSDNVPVYPIVVLTGSSTEDFAQTSLLAGAQDYILKDSITVTTLYRTIDNAIDRHHMLMKLKESERSAAAANRAKSALIGNVSHEIRTPMTAVIGLADILLDTNLNEDQQTLVKLIKDNGNYLVEILNDLLDLSRMEAGMLELTFTPVDIKSFIDGLVKLLNVRSRVNNTELQSDIDPSIPPRILCDAVRLRQILINLISNAIKFTPNGNVLVSVKMNGSQDQQKLCFIVQDSGCGIPEEDLEVIFEPFLHATNTKGGEQCGTGLGLSICKKLVTAMDGRIYVKSTKGQGSCFTVELPLKSVPQNADADNIPVIPDKLNTYAVPGKRILLAEDTRTTQMLITRYITQAGGIVKVVGDGNELVQTLENEHHLFDLLITDLRMPGVDGLQAIHNLRKINNHLPVILLTADRSQEIHDTVNSLANTVLIEKPFNRDEFVQTMYGLVTQLNRVPT